MRACNFIENNGIDTCLCNSQIIIYLQVEVTDAALLVLVESYCREAGVRNLLKQLGKIYRKVCLTHFYILIKMGNFIIVRLPLRDDSP